jgi:hypothetical protein
MNRYGRQAWEHYQRHRPRTLAGMDDPETTFTEFGQVLAAQIEEQARALAGQAPPGEGYLARLRRLNTARFQAESQVLREELLLETDDL